MVITGWWCLLGVGELDVGEFQLDMAWCIVHEQEYLAILADTFVVELGEVGFKLLSLYSMSCCCDGTSLDAVLPCP